MTYPINSGNLKSSAENLKLAIAAAQEQAEANRASLQIAHEASERLQDSINDVNDKTALIASRVRQISNEAQAVRALAATVAGAVLTTCAAIGKEVAGPELAFCAFVGGAIGWAAAALANGKRG